MTCSLCINISLPGFSVNRRGSLLRRSTVCKAYPLCFCRPFRGRSWLTMPAILSTLLPQMTVSVARRLVTESRDQHYTPAPAPTPTPAPAANQRRPQTWSLSAVPSPGNLYGHGHTFQSGTNYAT